MKTKFNLCRMLVILFLALWGDSLCVHAAKTAWAVCEVRGVLYTSVTFYYTESKPSGRYVFELNSGDTDPEWIPRNTGNNRITTVRFDESFAEARPTTCYKWFRNCIWLQSIEGIEYLNTSEVTNMDFMFYGCTQLGDFLATGLTNLNTSKVATMAYMFGGCSNLTTLDVSSFDTSNVTNMTNIFSGCYSLSVIKGLEHWNTSKVENMSAVFYGCEALATIDLSNFDTQSATTMQEMFYGCSGLTAIKGIENWNTSEVTNLTKMFQNCSELTSIDLSNFNTRKTTTTELMFFGCSNLKRLYLGEHFSTESLDNHDRMFALTADGATLCDATVYNRQSTEVPSHAMFAGLTVKTYVPINATAEYGTICVPVGSTLAEDSFAGFDHLYTVTAADKNDGIIILQEAETLEPGVPYVYHRYVAEGDEEDKIVYDASLTATAPANEGSILKGTFASITAPDGSYILQTDGKFHRVPTGNTTLTVGAYRAYIDLSSMDVDAGYAPIFCMAFGDGSTTAIDNIEGADVQPDVKAPAYYDLQGRRVSAPKAGCIYIVNGKKVMFKN